mgnify:FL=1
MLDFFKDVVLEAKGIDSEKAHKENIKKKELSKTKYYILSNKVKIIMFAFGIIYLLIEVMNIVIFWEKNGAIFIRNKGIILSIIDIAILVLLTQKNKKAEISAIFLGIFFMIVMYASTVIFGWF